MSETSASTRDRVRARNWAIIATVASLSLFLSALQWHVNGSQSPYATDVGEIQNALPRWGTIHFTGYPQYTFLGSLFVTILRPFGAEPAAGASLFSAVWGALTIGWLTLLLSDLGVWKAGAALLAFLFALTGSMWIDATIAEIHTMTMFLSVGSLHLALRYGRNGSRRDLLWLVVVFTQGVVHQRAMAFLAPTLLVLVWPRLRDMLADWKAIIGLALLAPLTYLYLPIRDWMGADWTFNAPGTWWGFSSMIMDTKASRIIDLPGSLSELWERLRLLVGLIHDDLAAPVTMFGMLALAIPLARGRERAREGLAWVLGIAVHGVLCLIIWEGRVSDALLAAKLPLILFAIMGLAYALTWAKIQPLTRAGAMFLIVLMIGYTYQVQHPKVVAITQDPASETTIATVEALPRDSNKPTVVWTLWGHDYWALRYAQAYRGELQGLTLVDHNADPANLVDRRTNLVTLRKTFYERPVDWWREQLGDVALGMPSAGMVHIYHMHELRLGIVTQGDAFHGLGNGMEMRPPRVTRRADGAIQVDIIWIAAAKPEEDWSVAVHLLSQDPPTGPEHILDQADQQHPVAGLYPVTQWAEYEQVHDVYVLEPPEGSHPVAVRIGMYRQDADGQFINTKWVTLPIPE